MATQKKALISGVTGQDGSYLAELLLEKGYEVHGLIRRSSILAPERLGKVYKDGRSLHERFFLHYGDLTDASGLSYLLERIRPDEVYNLGAQSHVGISFETPVYTAEVVALGPLKFLEAIRTTEVPAKFYQASSSEMFGNAPAPQSETTPLLPVSPYAIAKVAAYHFTKNYRESYGIFACNGILFNHESPRRGENFVTRKISIGVAEILAGKRDFLMLGNMDARRDWGYAPEYVEAMWRMFQAPEPDDYVIATGETHSVREFVEATFEMAGIKDWEKHVKIDEQFKRPNEVHDLRGDPKKAKEKLGWEAKVKFRELAKIMLEAECERQGIRISR